MGRSSTVPWTYCPCTPQQWVDIFVHDDRFYVRASVHVDWPWHRTCVHPPSWSSLRVCAGGGGGGVGRQIEYHQARGDIDIQPGTWVDAGGDRLTRTMTFLAPIHAPKRVLQIIGKEHSVITETQVLDKRPADGATATAAPFYPAMAATYKPDTLGSYCDLSSVFRVRPASDGRGGCEATAEVRVVFKMPLVGGLFEVRAGRGVDLFVCMRACVWD